MGVGLVMVYSTAAAMTVKGSMAPDFKSFPPELPSLRNSFHSTYYLVRQAMWIGAAIALILLFYTFKQESLFAISIVLLGISIVMLTLVLVPGFGVRTRGATRWLRLPLGLRLQPSEIAKVAVVLFTAVQLSRIKQENLNRLTRGVPVLLAPLGVVGALMLKEPDFGGTLVIGFIVFALLYAGGIKIRHLILVGIVAGLLVSPLVLSSRYRRERILAFVYPERYEQHANWQLNQSLIALGSGGVFGRGLGESAQKYHFLSEAHTDFIFSIIGEEMGFTGSMAVIILFVAFLVVGLRIAFTSPTPRGSLIALGMTLMILIPTLINMMVATKSGPAKGLALPFISYGGSSLIANAIAVGVLMNISRNCELIGARQKRRRA